ncbi:iron complex outermembrane receptor protein [Pseudoduganella flava]|uniref:Iron complex outermembrane receptor protein n=1 Tax=Pseudoduganella flava TaxID=871742 RepID=A0A562PGG9_9BURK|nr:TonB-dependent receptor [Pseudoduganella flava]QGZ40283.1 TonB-dependent receptor [Pseudoduganella flava]TWI43468.1 iron complex outermembrane receptor protein [Pseudoduganella flava]
MKVKQLAHMIALIGVVGPAVAQQADQPMQRVEITGSSIKRVAKEGALPVQTITSDAIQKAGVTNAEALLRLISANGTGADNMTSGNNVFGADADRTSGGASFASLRGLGPNATLVLLNGRRLGNNGGSGKAVDLNSIPLAAIARVEILKDGASAIYGTDAIGGVVNFILKTDYQGLEASTTLNGTEAGGGMERRYSVVGGYGDLETNGWNVMASVTREVNDKLASSQRDFANGYQPARGLSPDTTGTPYANILTGAGTALGTGFKMPGDSTTYLQAGLLSLQGKCDSIPGMSQYASELWTNVTPITRTRYSCAYDYGGDYVMSFPVERTTGVSRGTFKINADHRVFVELLGSRTKTTAELTPLQISTSLANGNAYPVNGPYYQDLSPYIASYDKTKPIIYKWRAAPFGNRTQDITLDNYRALVALEGTLAGKYDYKLGLSKSGSKARMDLVDGYGWTDKIYAALGSGIINPWVGPGQSQTQQATDLIASTKYMGAFQHGRTTMTQLDGSISGEVLQLPAGALSLAAGFDLRRETYGFAQDVDATKILLAPGNANLAEATRYVRAVYAEALVPVLKDLEVQLAIRRDNYSLVGATTNPKVAFRYQPKEWLLFRGSASKGFLAPSFAQLYAGRLSQELPNGVIDQEGCAAHPGNPDFCAIPRLDYNTGGNPNLRPETSKQGTLGVVIEPFKNFSASLDWWAINIKDRILNRTPQIVLQNWQYLQQYIIRDPNTQVIDHVEAGWINAAGLKTRGVDVGLRYDNAYQGYKYTAVLDGTYMDSFKFAEFEGQPYKEQVSQFNTRDVYLRWKHTASLTVARGNWSALLLQRYASGYNDQVPNGGKGTPPAGFDPRVHHYTKYDLSATYTGFRNTTITVGIQNLFDEDPPFTAHNVDEVVGAGWDPRVADPRGRALSFTLKYKFF